MFWREELDLHCGKILPPDFRKYFPKHYFLWPGPSHLYFFLFLAFWSLCTPVTISLLNKFLECSSRGRRVMFFCEFRIEVHVAAKYRRSKPAYTKGNFLVQSITMPFSSTFYYAWFIEPLLFSLLPSLPRATCSSLGWYKWRDLWFVSTQK